MIGMEESNMGKQLRVGLVGCGGVAQQTHLPVLLGLNDVVVKAACDRNEELAKEAVSKCKDAKAYSEISRMLESEDLDIIDICTPPQTHASLAIEALANKCHVLMEKPMALKTSDCDDMIDTAKRNGVKLCIIHNQIFSPPFLRAKKLVAEGTIGEFIGMRLFHSDHRDEMIMRKDYWIHKLPGGLIGETGPHPVYESLAFLKRVRDVDIYAKRFLEHPWAPFDEFRIELEGETGMSSITISYAGNHGDIRIDIMGTEGIIHLDLCSMLLVQYGEKTSSKPIPLAHYFISTSSQLMRGIVSNAFNLARGRLHSGHKIVIERFVDSIIRDGVPPVTGEEGRETVKAMEMIVKRLNEKYGT